MSTEQTEMAMTQVTAHLRVGGPNDAGFYKVALSKSGRTHIEWLSADEAIAFAAALSAERVKELEANREFSQQGIDTLEQRLAEVTRHLTDAQATIEAMLTVGANFARRQLDTTTTAPAAPAAGTPAKEDA